MRTMYDSVTPANIPADAAMVAGYIDGQFANLAEMRTRFPDAVIVGIATNSSTNWGQVLDVEQYDATPAQAPAWVASRRAAGGDPTVYCALNNWPAVRDAFIGAHVPEPHYWVAHYDGVASIPAGAVAAQYADIGPYDLSAVADYWPGVDPAPQGDNMSDYTPAQLQQYAQLGAAAALRDPAVRGLLQADTLWWEAHALAGTVPAGASPAAAASILAIHAAYTVLKDEPEPAPVAPGAAADAGSATPAGVEPQEAAPVAPEPVPAAGTE